MANKVKYGLKNVYFAVATIADTGAATYSTPVAIPGAVNLSMEASGDTTRFRADNIDYWIGESNKGYEGDLEIALIPDAFRTSVLGYVEDSNGLLLEDAEADTVHFALLFEFSGDANHTRHVLYNCTSTRPAVSGATTGETLEPETETLTLTATSIYNATLEMNIIKADCPEAEETQYEAWFTTVYQSTALAT